MTLLLPPLGRSQADAQQPLNPRDLTYTPPKPPASGLKPTSNVTIPRGYALIIGIANYKNLAADAQLKFSERDAESIYSVLISKEGGNFPAENVHKVIGSAATLKRIREELEEWLPLTTHDDDRVVVYFAGHG
ncbi:MAG: caspase family protein, partial [Acidobacteriota bacterium]|nr:caspase family protein [Acidobacteriota bacterium]